LQTSIYLFFHLVKQKIVLKRTMLLKQVKFITQLTNY